MIPPKPEEAFAEHMKRMTSTSSPTSPARHGPREKNHRRAEDAAAAAEDADETSASITHL